MGFFDRSTYSACMNLLQELKSSTDETHRRLERELDLLSPAFSATDYRRLLERFYGFFLPLENELLCLELPYELDRRCKLPWLKQDLHALGASEGDLDRLPLCETLPAIHDLSTAVGALYVVEGSTLGGKVLTKHFKEKLKLSPMQGLAYFSAYQEETLEMWRRFREKTSELEATGALNQGVTIETAGAVFETLRNWLSPLQSDANRSVLT
jgi:heme oxygenase